jgi:uncharacterized membrane protein YkvA (DUF1232 family)
MAAGVRGVHAPERVLTKPAIAERLRALKRETMALYFAARDPRTPLAAKVLAAVVVTYALSPIDLIPDFIPVIGLLWLAMVALLGLWAVRAFAQA